MSVAVQRSLSKVGESLLPTMFPFPPCPNIDMSGWIDGPWQQESSAVAWIDGRTGLNCAMIRHDFLGSWCGYVAVDPEHPLHGKLVLDGRLALSMLLPAHGSISYSREDTEGFWWFGFDCHHSGDLTPGLLAWSGAAFREYMLKTCVYRDQDYVHGIVTRLAWALTELRTLAQAANETKKDDSPK